MDFDFGDIEIGGMASQKLKEKGVLNLFDMCQTAKSPKMLMTRL